MLECVEFSTTTIRCIRLISSCDCRLIWYFIQHMKWWKRKITCFLAIVSKKETQNKKSIIPKLIL